MEHRRRSIRLKGYDYSQAGAYFITICTQDRACLFGEIADGEMRLNDAGRMVVSQWSAQTNRFPVVRLDAFVAMPNHIHGILWIESDVTDGHPDDFVGAGLVPAHAGVRTHVSDGATTDGATTDGATTNRATANRATTNRATTNRATTRVAPTVGDIVGTFKSLTTVAYTRGVEQSGWPGFHGKLWQRNYYEHIIRDDNALSRIRQYIIDNPAQWAVDRENPVRLDTEIEGNLKGLGYGV
ncbi:MAG: hypothetical protein LBP99_07980 [Azoarcus sp.]|nr:hypothetical protein [Azoarcus sp.]